MSLSKIHFFISLHLIFFVSTINTTLAQSKTCGAPNPGKLVGGSGSGFSLTGDINRRWSDRDRIKIRIYGGSKALRDKVIDYAKDWTRFANLYMDFGEHSTPDIRVGFNQRIGHWSQIGTDAKKIPQNKMTMNLALNDRSSEAEIRRVTLHEFGHALGFIHEHQSPKAGIRWNKPQVYKVYAEEQGWDKEEVNLNVFKKYSSDSVNASKFDPKSIMIYPIDKSLTLDNFHTDWNTRLSDMDKAHAATLYPWTPHSLFTVKNDTNSRISFEYRFADSHTWKKVQNSDGRIPAKGSFDFWSNAGNNAKFQDAYIRFDNGKGKQVSYKLETTNWRPRKKGDYPTFSNAIRYVFRFKDGKLDIFKEK